MSQLLSCIHVTVTNVTQSVKVKCKKVCLRGNYIILDNNVVELDYRGTQRSLLVNTNADWVVTHDNWSDGDVIRVAKSNSGNALFSSDINEGLDRETSAIIQDKENTTSKTIIIKQDGRRQPFAVDGLRFILADGGTFNVIREDGF